VLGHRHAFGIANAVAVEKLLKLTSQRLEILMAHVLDNIFGPADPKPRFLQKTPPFEVFKLTDDPEKVHKYLTEIARDLQPFLNRICDKMPYRVKMCEDPYVTEDGKVDAFGYMKYTIDFSQVQSLITPKILVANSTLSVVATSSNVATNDSSTWPAAVVNVIKPVVTKSAVSTGNSQQKVTKPSTHEEIHEQATKKRKKPENRTTSPHNDPLSAKNPTTTQTNAVE
jgi:hypothetical protein